MINIDNVSKRYGSFQALKEINLMFKEGEFVAVLGPSGCGKTTLLKLLAGFMKPSEGMIKMYGEEIGSAKTLIPPNQRNIGMVFQSFALWPHMTVQEHVQFPLKHHRFVEQKLRGDAASRVQQVLNLVGLEHLATRFPSELSGGQKQRVALARAIAPEPSLLLMDEPLSALDAELRMEMRKEIQHIHREMGTTIVYVTHDQGEALAMADRIVVMNEGSIEQVDTPEIIYNQPKTVFVSTFVGKCNLLQGRWQGKNEFIPEYYPGVILPDIGVSPEFKHGNVYPIRPEQWSLAKPQGKGNQLIGKVAFSQFQGKEVHYTIQTGKQSLNVIQSIGKPRHQVGEQVALHICK
ncbi:ABC transporter ATP-binding protein [Metabacillus arenae]|uniref:Carnitine transport ATP-binding protein OpuCA n=1 Tax=Metabacillus arenae TaxID=2771434 RepID=A0A926S092_9BACI|nr:ABC transporter ATP-binding protein [Metabacillus arenae]MBD1383027.1 ABC transporter ATP-binding protein [Metabacillus arenae]